jgi:lipopolysaccharide transport system ATP-binding protein
MPNTVISVENVSKSYQLGVINTGTFRGDLQRWWAKFRGLPDPYLKVEEKDYGNRQGEIIWALRDINFQVQQGKALGIIGRNGAGKSTLLKILSRVTAPTSGEIKIKGRIASLLEVGTGFHPELTGRENILLNGAILGMNRNEIRHKLDEIVEFSGVEQFIDTPVKRYSSGMYVRLAFAVAAHLEPEILIVDEVLAVGDAEFQKKCLGKMSDVANGGRTVLFVSHNMSAVQDLCEDAIWIDKGAIIQSGPAKSIIAHYLSKKSYTKMLQKWDDLSTAPGNKTVRLLHAQIAPESGYDPNHLTVETPLILTFRIFNYRSDLSIYFNFQLYTQEGICVFNSASKRNQYPYGIVEGQCLIPGNFLNDNIYSVTFMAHYSGTPGVGIEEVLVFEIADIGRKNTTNYYGKWIGVIRPQLVWNINHLESVS